MDEKNAGNEGQQSNAIPELALSPEQAKHVKGGATDIFAKIGDIKGESPTDPKLDKLRLR